MIKPKLFLPLAFGVLASAGAITVTVNVDTSSVTSQNGAIYMQFDPGLNADPATATITNFQIFGVGNLLSVPPVQTNGDVSGALNSPPLILANTSGLNDYLHFLVFGDSLSFRVALNTTVSGSASSGSAFVFGLTSSDGLSPILTSDPGGFLGQVISDETGHYSFASLSPAASLALAGGVPEPSSAGLIGAGIGALWLIRRVGVKRN